MAEQHDPCAEAAHVHEQHPLAGVEDEARAQVRAVVHVVVRRNHQQVAGHAQVHRHEHVVLELPDEVLPAPAERLDPAPVHRVLELGGRRRLAPARVEDLHARQHATLARGGQMALDGLDLGQLGHYTESRTQNSQAVARGCALKYTSFRR